jgi:hypothetical protein
MLAGVSISANVCKNWPKKRDAKCSIDELLMNLQLISWDLRLFSIPPFHLQVDIWIHNRLELLKLRVLKSGR